MSTNGTPRVHRATAPLTQVDFERMGCQAPGCDHEHDMKGLVLVGACHPLAGSFVHYVHGVLEVACNKCKREIARIAVERPVDASGETRAVATYIDSESDRQTILMRAVSRALLEAERDGEDPVGAVAKVIRQRVEYILSALRPESRDVTVAEVLADAAVARVDWRSLAETYIARSAS